jgi:ATP phosphoribosyltransferase regulatory subunit
MTTNARAIAAINRLEEVYTILTEYGLEQYVSVDLGMLSNYNYYTGIIFKGFTYGTGAPIVGGGRYDHLLGQFGKQAPSVGIGIQIDRLMMALSAQKIAQPIASNNHLLLYDRACRKQAIAEAKSLREEQISVTLLEHKPSITKEQYMEYAKQLEATNVTIVTQAGTTQIIPGQED